MLWFSGQDGDVNVEKDPGLKEDLESGKVGSWIFFHKRLWGNCHHRGNNKQQTKICRKKKRTAVAFPEWIFGALSIWFLWFMDIYGYLWIFQSFRVFGSFNGLCCRDIWVSSLPLIYCLFLIIPGGLQFGRCRGIGLRGEFSTEMVVSAQGKVLPISHYVVVSNMFSCSSLPGEMIFNWVETTK